MTIYTTIVTQQQNPTVEATIMGSIPKGKLIDFISLVW